VALVPRTLDKVAAVRRWTLLLAFAALGMTGCGGSALTVAVTAPTTGTVPPQAAPKPAHHSRQPKKNSGNKSDPSRTRTVTVVRTVTAPAAKAPAPSNAAYASTYPPTFASSFGQSCTQTGLGFTQCVCILRHIESQVSYSTVASSFATIFTGKPPSWYKGAAASCAVAGP
jgi:hypothetical protein